MARYERLPIYKAALDLTVHLELVVAGFARYHKYTLGTELRQGSRAVLRQVLRANNARSRSERGAELLRLREEIDALLLTMRVGKEVKAFKSFAAYLHAMGQAGSVARQKCQEEPGFPRLWESNFPHRVENQDSVDSAARTSPAFSFSFSR